MAGVDDVEVLSALLSVMPPEEAAYWLISPHAELDGRTPDDLIEEGRKDQVLAFIRVHRKARCSPP